LDAFKLILERKKHSVCGARLAWGGKAVENRAMSSMVMT